MYLVFGLCITVVVFTRKKGGGVTTKNIIFSNAHLLTF
jgi:hypothetical protein